MKTLQSSILEDSIPIRRDQVVAGILYFFFKDLVSLSLLPISSPQDDVTDASSPCLTPELLALQDALYVIYIIYFSKERVRP